MPLHVERRDRVALLTLDDPQRRNALTGVLVRAIVDAFDKLERDDGVGAVVITGAPPAFCAGADLGDLRSLSDGDERAARDVRGIYDGFLRVLRSPLPTVAAVNGAAVGAGLNLALCCDLRIAAPEARFDPRFLSIGLHPGGGHTWLLDRAVGPQTARALVLFRQALDGAAAVASGLAWRCDDDPVAVALELGGRAAEVPAALRERTKASLDAAPWHRSFDDALEMELERQAWSFRQPFFRARS